jgi:predicted AlkP superfamily pyrophosphatase or phosphodiesterase
MARPVVLVLIDGLGYETAVERLGYMEGLAAAGAARRWRMRTALPSLSRPLYETVHTGVAPHEHGITSNDTVRLSSQPSVFSVARAAGRTTAAASYYWFSELYNRAPFDAVQDIETDDPAQTIQHGRFYQHADFPDSELFHRAALLSARFKPDFLLVHPMGADTIGHRFGGKSKQYETVALQIDNLLAVHVPRWREAGYEVMVTADHGMDENGNHGGSVDIHCLVPFYYVGAAVPGGIAAEEVSQTAVAPTVLRAMGLTPPPSMRASALA